MKQESGRVWDAAGGICETCIWPRADYNGGMHTTSRPFIHDNFLLETELARRLYHGDAAIDRDGLHRRMRKNKSQRQCGGQAQLRHDRLEVVAVGAEAVQPDDAALRVFARNDFNRIGCLHA